MSVSFCHVGGPHMASYRYRCATPAAILGAKINDPSADVLIFSKPDKQDVRYLVKAKDEGRPVIVDVCDMHFDLAHYELMVKLADAVTCPTQWFSDYLRDDYGIEAHVIGDPYEYDLVLPHCGGERLLWFGHGLNMNSLIRVAPSIEGFPLRIVSNVDGFIPWSKESMLREFVEADIVIMPETAPYKSANRTIEAIRQGCFVVAEPHPAINHFPGIWLGNIRKGIEWAQQNLSEANSLTAQAQSFVTERFSPQTVASAWRTIIQKVQSSSTSDRALAVGMVGSMSI